MPAYNHEKTQVEAQAYGEILVISLKSVSHMWEPLKRRLPLEWSVEMMP
jgi:hypothetical protein